MNSKSSMAPNPRPEGIPRCQLSWPLADERKYAKTKGVAPDSIVGVRKNIQKSHSRLVEDIPVFL